MSHWPGGKNAEEIFNYYDCSRHFDGISPDEVMAALDATASEMGSWNLFHEMTAKYNGASNEEYGRALGTSADIAAEVRRLTGANT